MNSHIIRLPDIGEGITEAEIVEWLVSVGDVIAEDQSIGSIMTDKAAVEIPSPVAGVVEALSGEVGEVLSVGAELARIRTSPDKSDVPETSEFAPDVESVTRATTVGSTSSDERDVYAVPDEPAQTSTKSAAEPPGTPVHDRIDDSGKFSGARPGLRPTHLIKPAASPAVRRRAYRSDLSLEDVRGSGPGGRVLHEDLDRHLASGSPAAVSEARQPGKTVPSSGPGGEVEEIKVMGMRRAIARKMQIAKQHIPHFSYVEEIDVSELESLRAQLNGRSDNRHARLTLLPFIVLATVRALAEFPRMNARFDDEADIIRQYHEVHMGIATQTDNGLMVPVLRQAHLLDLRSVAAAISSLAEAARKGSLALADQGMGTITVTSLGALGGLVSTPVINYPEVAIVGVNRIVTRPMFQADQVVPRQLMNLSCSFDHRVIDGHDAARFVQCIKGFLEFPPSLFVPV